MFLKIMLMPIKTSFSFLTFSSIGSKLKPTVISGLDQDDVAAW